MSVTMIELLKLSNLWVNTLEGYRKKTAILVNEVLEQNTSDNPVSLPDLYDKVSLSITDQYRKEDATKMVRVMVNTLSVSDERKKYEEKILKKARATRKPLNACLVSPK